MSIVVVGTAFVDIKGFPKNTYIPRGRNAGRVEYIHGGVGRNVAEDIANLGLRSIYIGLVDESPMGRDVLAKLNRHKVCTDYVITTPDGLGTWLAVFDSNGDVAGSISHRPHTYPLLEVLEEKGDEIFAKADSVVLEADIDWDVVKKVFALARKYDKKVLSVVGNMSIFASRRESLREFDCLICNQQEAELLFQDDYSALSPEEMSAVLAEKVRRIGMSFMVVTMGSRGAVYADRNGLQGFCPARSVQVKDATGAGDAFCAGVASALTYGKSLPEAVELGTHLAAAVITSLEDACPQFRPEELGLGFGSERD